MKAAIAEHVPYMTESQKNRYLKLTLSDDEGRIYYDLKRRVFADIKDEELEKLQAETKKTILEFDRIKERRYEEKKAKAYLYPEI